MGSTNSDRAKANAPRAARSFDEGKRLSMANEDYLESIYRIMVESGATDADKLKTLLEIRNMQQAKQQTRSANTLFDYESDDDSDGGYPSDGYR